ncbi:monosaccharide ABC transporter substrate-binding protein, CUT2 family [Agrococcus baldri]|uniref:Monosaccharide ABC transporter substrate-binding protein, CUT2 family n=1 Tax=Agrococcus baldri TaxID=153730 RepID=A0AA94KYL7_9MICO|nr:ABC transporter substrate-binding protein [Agrococcus baldri]SFR99975.1 monosaccharide ABC transporter substrate-binding protein, CUT2 family [Agrococcus baldri]
MRKKKFQKQVIAVGITAVAGLALGGCASSGTMTETDGGQGEADDPIRVAFIPGISSDPFFRAMEIAATAEAAELGIELIWQGASDAYSPQAQLPFVDAALADDIDALVLVPTDADALQPSVARATGMGIPVVTVDTSVTDRSELVAHITGDNVDGGSRAAEELSDQIGGEGTVLVISASPTNTTGTQRVEGFEATLASDHPGLEMLPVQYAYSQPSEATTILNTTLLEYPDLAGVFAVDGTSCTGAIAALNNADMVGEVSLICYDAYAAQVAELEAGSISGLIAQDPAQEARLALQYALAAVTGEGADAIESEVVIPNVVMNLDNLAETREYEYAE